MNAGESPLPLDGIVVVELTDNIAGPWCGRQFAALGAEVWKLEHPDGGDISRSLGPFIDDDHVESSVPWLYLNEGKKSAAVAIDTAAGLALARQLLARTDVLIVSLTASNAAAAALDRESLTRDYPDLVVTSLTPYGMTGPKRDYRGCELTEYAASGLMHLTGEPGREPLQVGIPMAEFAAGQAAAATTIAGLIRRDAIATGQYADIAITEVGAALLDFQLAFFVGRGYLAERLGNLNDKGYPWGIFPCRDGWAAILAGPADRWPQAAKIAGIPELAEARFATAQSRQDHRDELEAYLLPWLLEHDRQELFELGQSAGLAWGYVRDAAEVADCVQLKADGFFDSIEHPRLGPVPSADLPYTLAGVEPRRRPPPLLGQHTGALLEDVLGLGSAAIVELEESRVVKRRDDAGW